MDNAEIWHYVFTMYNVVKLGVQCINILEKLKKLADENSELLLSKSSVEKYVENEICTLLDAEASIGENITLKYYKDIDVIERVKFSGSAVEGAMMARCFQKKEDWQEVEIDIMYNLFTIPQEVSHLLEPVEDKPGFVRLPLCQELCQEDFYILYILAMQILEGHVPYSLDEMPKYISPLLMKGALTEGFPRPSRYRLRNVMFQRMFNIKESKCTTETTQELKFDASGIHLSNDSVPAIRLHFWPHEAGGWITRCRRWWPQQNTIQSIVIKGCHVVSRSSPGGNVHSEWRLSFSGPEAILAQLRSRKQQEAYYFFKMFFYRYLKCVESSEPEGKPIYSYVIKTTMLWAYEELPPEDPIWASLENSVEMLLFKLLGSLEAGFLPHYFIPEINLLERVGEDVRIKCAAIISRWQSNILMSFPFDISEKLKFINRVRNAAQEQVRNLEDNDEDNKRFVHHS